MDVSKGPFDKTAYVKQQYLRSKLSLFINEKIRVTTMIPRRLKNNLLNSKSIEGR